MSGCDREPVQGAAGAGLVAQPVEHRREPAPLLGVVGIQQQLVAAAAHGSAQQFLEHAQIAVVRTAQRAEETEIG